MRTIVTNVYSYSELSEEAKKNAIESLRNRVANDPYQLQFTSDEMLESLKKVTDACNLVLCDWSFGSYCRDWKAKVYGESDDLKGNRALAWFLRVLLKHGYSRPKKFNEMKFEGVCGFTGVCFDEDVCETVWKELLDGSSVKKAFNAVSYEFCKTLEREYEYLTSDDGIKELLDENEEQFSIDGKLI